MSTDEEEVTTLDLSDVKLESLKILLETKESEFEKLHSSKDMGTSTLDGLVFVLPDSSEEESKSRKQECLDSSTECSCISKDIVSSYSRLDKNLSDRDLYRQSLKKLKQYIDYNRESQSDDSIKYREICAIINNYISYLKL